MIGRFFRKTFRDGLTLKENLKMKYLYLSICLCIGLYTLNGQKPDANLKLSAKTFKSHSGQEVRGDVGDLQVPENRADPDSEDINIHFIRLKSSNPNPQAPLIYLEGGPGASCTWQAENPEFLEHWLPFLDLGDVILLDQRGTGIGRNRVLYIWQEALPENILLDETVMHKHFAKMGQKAWEAYQERGVDLSGYTTLESVADIETLRKALGYSKLALLGFSYGSHLGQAYIKYHGERVSNAVLIGVEGLDHTFKLPLSMDVQFRKIALLSDADPNVNKDVPDFMALYQRVMEKLEKEPVELKIVSPITQETMTLKVGAKTINRLLRYDIGDASDIPVFPRFLYSIDQGDYSILQWFVQRRIGGFYGIQGMSMTMDAASGLSPLRQQRIKAEEKLSMFSNMANFDFEVVWPFPDLGDEFREPLISNVRTLFMSGTLDFNTPPYQAEEVRWGFSNSSHIIIDYAGHEQILTHPQAGSAILRFLKGENIDDVALFYPKPAFIPVKGKAGAVSHPSIE